MTLAVGGTLNPNQPTYLNFVTPIVRLFFVGGFSYVAQINLDIHTIQHQNVQDNYTLNSTETALVKTQVHFDMLTQKVFQVE